MRFRHPRITVSTDKLYVGEVFGLKMHKTVKVKASFLLFNHQYNIYLKGKKTFYALDEHKKYKIGDIVLLAHGTSNLVKKPVVSQDCLNLQAKFEKLLSLKPSPEWIYKGNRPTDDDFLLKEIEEKWHIIKTIEHRSDPIVGEYEP